jgi:hypothetical protein
VALLTSLMDTCHVPPFIPTSWNPELKICEPVDDSATTLTWPSLRSSRSQIDAVPNPVARIRCKPVNGELSTPWSGT